MYAGPMSSSSSPVWKRRPNGLTTTCAREQNRRSVRWVRARRHDGGKIDIVMTTTTMERHFFHRRLNPNSPFKFAIEHSRTDTGRSNSTILRLWRPATRPILQTRSPSEILRHLFLRRPSPAIPRRRRPSNVQRFCTEPSDYEPANTIRTVSGHCTQQPGHCPAA